MKLYRQNCAGCHGASGRPSPWGSRGFYPRVPQFGVLPPALSEAAMSVAIRRGIRYSGMGAWDAGMLADDDLWRVVAFLAHLRDLPPGVAAEWRGTR
jgi:mono/diheme cytochrome c family protein